MNQTVGHFLLAASRSPRSIPLRQFLHPCVLIVFFLLVRVPVLSQGADDLLKNANEYFEKEQYHTAAQYYQVIVGIHPDDPQANYRLAECYRAVFDYYLAANYYQQAMDLDQKTYPQSRFYLAQMQKSMGNFKKARDGFEEFIRINNQRSWIPEPQKSALLQQAEVEMEGSVWAIEQLGKSWTDIGFKLMPEPVNSAYNDYAATASGVPDLISITSGRKEVRGSLVDNRFGDYFTDNFRFRSQGDQWIEADVSDHFDRTNTKFSDGAGTYNTAGDKYYFTSCYEGNAFCKLYVIYNENGTWKKPMLLNEKINAPGYDSKHPTLTSGGDTLIFVSNRPGGSGGNDLWFSIDAGDEQWQDPQPLPGNINTPFNEVSPFCYGGNLLFFSSDGHPGIGSMDIFMSKDFTNPMSEIQNLGTPFNSGYDDSFFSVTPGRGFLSSNRPGGQGKFDIYVFNFPEPQQDLAGYLEEAASGTRLKSRIRDNDASNLYATRDEDQFYYDNLSADERARLERILKARQSSSSPLSLSSLSQEDFKYYNKLDIATKATIERLAIRRAREFDGQARESQMTKQEKLDWEYYHNIDDSEKMIIDRILNAWVEGRRIAMARLSVEEKEYTMDSANQERIESKLQMKSLGSLADSSNSQQLTQLGEKEAEARDLQQQLQQFIDEQDPAPNPEAEARIVDEFYRQLYELPLLTPRESHYFNTLSPGQRLRINRLSLLLEKQIREMNPKSIGDGNLAHLSSTDQWFYMGLSQDQRKIVDELVSAGWNPDSPYLPHQEQFMAGLTKLERDRVERMMGKPQKMNFEVQDNTRIAIVNTGEPEVQTTAIPLEQDTVATAYTPVSRTFTGAEIFFDFNKHTLRSEAVKTLEELQKSIKDSQVAIRIVIEGHTDNLGSQDYNQSLGMKRSQSAARFFQVEPDRIDISTVSHGEERPVYDNNTPLGRQMNRRVEVKIEGASFQSELQTYLVKPNVTLAMIAEATGFEELQIITWNGLEDKKLRPYQPIRLPIGLDSSRLGSILVFPQKSTADGNPDPHHTVTEGENMFRLAQLYDTTVQTLENLNHLAASDLMPGQQLRVR